MISYCYLDVDQLVCGLHILDAEREEERPHLQIREPVSTSEHTGNAGESHQSSRQETQDYQEGFTSNDNSTISDKNARTHQTVPKCEHSLCL